MSKNQHERVSDPEPSVKGPSFGVQRFREKGFDSPTKLQPDSHKRQGRQEQIHCLEYDSRAPPRTPPSGGLSMVLLVMFMGLHPGPGFTPSLVVFPLQFLPSLCHSSGNNARSAPNYPPLPGLFALRQRQPLAKRQPVEILRILSFSEEGFWP